MKKKGRKRIFGFSIKVGWIDGSGAAAHAYENLQLRQANPGTRTPALREPATQALIARTLNYGREPGVTLEGRRYPGIPARPFMDEARKIFGAKFPKIARKYAGLMIEGKADARTAAKAVATYAQDSIVTAIRTGTYAALSEATMKRRRGDGSRAVPLIDTGAMISSITAAVQKLG